MDGIDQEPDIEIVCSFYMSIVYRDLNSCTEVAGFHYGVADAFCFQER